MQRLVRRSTLWMVKKYQTTQPTDLVWGNIQANCLHFYRQSYLHRLALKSQVCVIAENDVAYLLVDVNMRYSRDGVFLPLTRLTLVIHRSVNSYNAWSGGVAKTPEWKPLKNRNYIAIHNISVVQQQRKDNDWSRKQNTGYTIHSP